MTLPDAATGGCMCGRYQYEASGAPETTLYCHCESCRKHTGAPLVALAGYTSDQVEWPNGEPPRYASSSEVRRAFCSDCGTPMTWEGEGLVEILIATMNSPEAFVPQLHIHHAERLRWLETTDTLPRFAVWHDDGEAAYLHDPACLSADQQVALVERYFSAVDDENLNVILETISKDCVFTVETHGVQLTGTDEITEMFQRLWGNHDAVRHYDFRFVPDPHGDRIAAQFQVENTEQDGSLTHKSNCNVFDIHEGRFSRIAVYMTGANTLDRE